LGRKSWSFDLRYLLGRPPWDTAVTPPELVELVEGGGLPPGQVLDLGCGTGTNCIYLARHDWEVVGVDFSILAIRRARRKARRARVDCQFSWGDVAELVFLTDPFDLALDIGCLHSLPSEGWERYAAGVARLVLPGGLYLLYAFAPRPDRPIPRGVAPEEVRSLFTPTFAMEREERGEDPSGLRSAWYWLRRLYPLQV
jgi:cyclopropane fatty-acyl-phospholipid synthase-like methyltransferase